MLAMLSRLALAALALTALPGPEARASSSDWVEAQGGRVRLVTSGEADAEGRIAGMIDIRLRPGWKTYWLDPGDAGVPPQIDVAASRNIAGIDVSFPAPQRHDEGYGSWAGYDRSVAFPVSFRLAEPGKPALIDASLFLGMCETICVPVQARLTLDPTAAPQDADDSRAVEAALAALPQAEAADFRAELLTAEAGRITVGATVPAGSRPVDLFVAGTEGFQFGLPKLKTGPGGEQFFAVKVLSRPDRAGAAISYTLVSDRGSVSGTLALPPR
jgi:DsbC/DsbD-like thiol-disulfide interchange protein